MDDRIDWMLMFRTMVEEYTMYGYFDYPLIDVSVKSCMDFVTEVISPNIEFYDPTAFVEQPQDDTT